MRRYQYSQCAENMFSVLEGKVERAYDKIKQAVDNDSACMLPGEEKDILAQYVCIHGLRQRHWKHIIDTMTFNRPAANATIENMANDMAKSVDITLQDERNEGRDLEKNYKQEIEDALENPYCMKTYKQIRGWSLVIVTSILRYKQYYREFILGDIGLTVTDRYTGNSEESGAFGIVLDKTTAVWFTPNERADPIRRLTDNEMDLLNLEMFHRSNVVAASSRARLERVRGLYNNPGRWLNDQNHA